MQDNRNWNINKEDVGGLFSIVKENLHGVEYGKKDDLKKIGDIIDFLFIKAGRALSRLPTY